jgi:hypothetical protein
MKARIASLLMGLALIAGVAAYSPSDASASDACSELGWAMNYHFWEGNSAYVHQLYLWAVDAGCDFAPV